MERTVDVAGERRTTVAVGELFGFLDARTFSIIVDGIGETPADLVVEASTYGNVGDVFWASGTNVTGTLR